MLTLTCCQDHILTEIIWVVWSETSYSGDERCNGCGTNNEQTLKIELLSQWKLEAEFRKTTKLRSSFFISTQVVHDWRFLSQTLLKSRKRRGLKNQRHARNNLFKVDIYMCECLIHVGTVQLYSIEITFETGPSLRVDRQSPSKKSCKSNFQTNRPTCPSSRLSLVSSPLSSLSLL